ncbi:sensor histidine kinase [Sedimenticola hydrogenitrophicus]|uniref:sensor histidine kinase n=1 Tax=Sedimenticola hydrogenitrophicus TaxID=2967975 RepID=UPI0023B02B97|nr:ATP-binding protein [Sedimenticola hydrogenitrophicus]
MKLLKMLKTQIAAALVLIMLLFGTVFALSMMALQEQQSYNILLNITSRLEQTAQSLVSLGMNYSMNVPPDSSSYARDVKLYYSAMHGQVEMLDTITNSFMLAEFPPALTDYPDPFQPHLTPATEQAVSAVEEIWKDFRGGIMQALGNDSDMPRLDRASDYIAHYNAPLVASINILLSRIQQQTDQRLTQVHRLHLGLLFAAVMITFGVFAWFFLAVLRPLRLAVNGFQKVARGDFGYQVPITIDNELALMTSSFNTLSLRLHAIFRLIDQIQQGSDLNETLGFVAKEFASLLPLDWVGALFVAGDNSTIVLEGSYRAGQPEITRRNRYPLGNTLLLKALESGEPLHIPNMSATGSQNPDFQFLNHLISEGVQDAIFLPITDASPIPGVLAFGTCTADTYTPEHLELLTNIAGLVTHSFGKTVKLAEHIRLAAIGGFASSIAHEIRSPLSTISMALGYFQDAGLSDSANKRATLAQQEAERMARLLEEILLYAKPLQLRLEPIDIKQLLTQLFETHRKIAQEKQQRFELVAPDTELQILGDQDRLIQIFLNLAKNACDAAPLHDPIVWRLEKDSIARVLKVSVTNGGNPIPEDQLPQLFNPFFTTKAHGTGLGLSIVKRIVEAHGGEIVIASSQAQGTRVTLLLPLA